MEAENSDITGYLTAWRKGDGDALEQLISVIYQKLRIIARNRLAKEGDNPTLDPTELVHEVFVKLTGQSKIDFENRAHFFAITSQLMRRVLLDHAKSRNRVKRGGEVVFVTLGAEEQRQDPKLDVRDLNRALEKLAEQDTRLATIVELKFFAGLSNEEIAEVIDISLSTVYREWKFAKRWLYRFLST